MAIPLSNLLLCVAMVAHAVCCVQGLCIAPIIAASSALTQEVADTYIQCLEKNCEAVSADFIVSIMKQAPPRTPSCQTLFGLMECPSKLSANGMLKTALVAPMLTFTIAQLCCPFCKNKSDASASKVVVVNRATGATRSQPAVRSSSGGLLETMLTVAPHHMQEGQLSFWTRAYDGSTPGPTLREKLGDTLELTIRNSLGANGQGETLKSEFNMPHAPNTTNLHTHALMVSPEKSADSFARRIEPGTDAVFTYRTPKDHPTGNFWYHPHSHGASSLQVGNGMAGMPVVDDDAGAISADLAAIPEIVLVLQTYNFLT